MTRIQELRSRIPFGMVVLFLIVLVTPMFLTAQPANAAICADSPTPANPWTDDMSRILAPPLDDDGKIAAEPRPDPFKNPDTPLYKWYGTNYKFFAYDASCNWGTDLVWTLGAGTDSSGFAWATYPFAIAYGVTHIVMGDSWKEALDSAISSVTAVMGETMFTALAAIVITVAGVLAFWAARVGDVPRLFRSALWVVCLLGVAAISIANPQYLTNTADKAVTSVVTTAGSVVPDGTDGAETANGDEEATAQDKVLRNLDSINRSVYYRAWLQGQLGDADGVAATKYGTQLFKSTHLTWWEGRTVQLDPNGAGQDVIDEKSKAFEETVKNIEEEDPAAFEYIKGHNVKRTGTIITAILQAWLSLPFYIVAMAGVGVALVTLRVVVMLLPVLSLAGMMEPSRMWMLGVLQRYTRNVVIAPLAFTGALVNVTVVGELFRSSLPWVAKVFFAAVIMIVLFNLIKPTVLPAGMASKGMSMARRVVSTAAGVKLGNAASQGQDDDSNDDKEAPKRNQSETSKRSGGKSYRPVATVRESSVPAIESSRVPESHRLPSADDVVEPQRRARVQRTADGSIPMGPAAGAATSAPVDAPEQQRPYTPAAGTTDAVEPYRERPAERRARNPWEQEAPGSQWEQRALPAAPAPQPPQQPAQRGSHTTSVPVVYAPTAAPAEGTVSSPRVPEEGPKKGSESTVSASQPVTPEQVPVRDDSSTLEPDAVWMPESARPVAGERDGVSEANLSRNENDEQVFVIWTPEESEGGGQR